APARSGRTAQQSRPAVGPDHEGRAPALRRERGPRRAVLDPHDGGRRAALPAGRDPRPRGAPGGGEPRRASGAGRGGRRLARGDLPAPHGGGCGGAGRGRLPRRPLGMSWREALRLSNVAFTELSLQAVYAFRQGNVLPPGRSKNLVARSRRLVVQSKVVISAVLALLTLGAAAILHLKAQSPQIFSSIPAGLFQSAILTGLLSLDIALLWWTGVQVIPTLISSGVLPVLEPLPIDPRTFRRVAGILYLRLFDFPALTIIILTPIAVGIALGPLAGLAALPGAVVAVIYALALSLLTGRFFLRRVQGSRGGGGRTVVRWAYLVLWLVPAFAMFGFITAAPQFFRSLGDLAAQGPSFDGTLLVAAFPFSFAALPALAAGGTEPLAIFSPTVDLVLGVSVSLYAALAVWSIVWLAGAVRNLQFLPTRPPVDLAPVSSVLRPTGFARAVLVKDLRIASRTPGYAFLILLPILDAVAIGLLTYASPLPDALAASLALAAVTTAALLATFFGP